MTKITLFWMTKKKGCESRVEIVVNGWELVVLFYFLLSLLA